LAWQSGGFEADGSDEDMDIIDDALVEAIELRLLLAMKSAVGWNRAEQAGSERRVDALEELQEEKADGVALRQQLIAA
jgi:hypothetical protein